MEPTKLLCLLCLIAGLFFSCSKDNEEPIEKPIEEPVKEQVKLKASPGSDKKISFFITASKVTIDWGDGNTEEYTSSIPNGTEREFTHEYTTQNLQTISIETESIETFSQNTNTKGTSQEISFENSPQLEKIECMDQALTAITIKQCPKLEDLNCAYNQLNTQVLNSLFESLHSLNTTTKKEISINDNPGEASCNTQIAKDKGWDFFLDKKPEEEIPEEAYFDNEENVRIAITASFAKFTQFTKKNCIFEALYSNTLTEEDINGQYQYLEIYRHQVTPGNAWVGDLLKEAYTTIRQCNILIDRIPQKYDNYRYTAYTLRAYTYLLVIENWGDMPFLHEGNYNEIQASYPRTPQNEILSMMISNLKLAEQNLPEVDNRDNAIVSKYFAQALLAKIYAYQGDYINASKYANEIINSKQFSLCANNSDAFSDFTNKELITSLISAYTWEGDSHPNIEGISLIKKGKYMPLIRYAEILLIATESNIRQDKNQEAIQLINQLKTRNKEDLIDSNSSFETIIHAILEEYKSDLGKEGLYFPALKRSGKAEIALNIQPYRKLLPISQREIDVNPAMTQNPGY